jgi:hypothetical protein
VASGAFRFSPAGERGCSECMPFPVLGGGEFGSTSAMTQETWSEGYARVR